MNRMLILHCGPMKTGSTAIQDLLEVNKKKLLSLGISYHHIPAKGLLVNLENAILEESSRENKVIILSSEFFCQSNPILLGKTLQSFNGLFHAILVSRPLREIYPSLYLQNLKGSSRRITSFGYFLDRQIRSDLAPERQLGGQLMNFPALDARLIEAGCKTHWIQYDRKTLVPIFIKSLEEITSFSLKNILDPEISNPKGLSPRRSLRMEFAGLTRFINYLNRLNFLDDRLRQMILIMLLNISELLNGLCFSRKSPLSKRELLRCNAVDSLINQPFLDSRGVGLVEED